jgi:hypothetical protein
MVTIRLYTFKKCVTVSIIQDTRKLPSSCMGNQSQPWIKWFPVTIYRIVHNVLRTIKRRLRPQRLQNCTPRYERIQTPVSSTVSRLLKVVQGVRGQFRHNERSSGWVRAGGKGRGPPPSPGTIPQVNIFSLIVAYCTHVSRALIRVFQNSLNQDTTIKWAYKLLHSLRLQWRQLYR